ncbi:sigma-70 family RNA polymerase sigma factor [Motilibacter rhizosphaerae]|uniref:sigma-70 family RNA polymerase sigma factor n=1 Tax=Motilibacter rhizosphaerae TaxID=598652 RepID=UPI0013EEA8E0|nr:sigma-70 family RNA polymerase sigma factor [Motilibacter rhizosphaerae]
METTLVLVVVPRGGTAVRGAGGTMAAMRDDGQIEELYRAHAPAARRLAHLLVGDREVADDLVQDCFVRLLARGGSGVDDLDAYLRRAVVNASRSWLRRLAVRRARAHEAALAYGPGGVGDAVQADRADAVLEDAALRAALLQLPPRQRTAVVLRYCLDLPEAECAAVMECAVGTVKASAARGRARLAELLAEPGRAGS